MKWNQPNKFCDDQSDHDSADISDEAMDSGRMASDLIAMTLFITDSKSSRSSWAFDLFIDESLCSTLKEKRKMWTKGNSSLKLIFTYFS